MREKVMPLLSTFLLGVCFLLAFASEATHSAPSKTSKNQQKISNIGINTLQQPFYPESPFTEVLFTEGPAFNGDGYLPQQDDASYYYRNPGQFIVDAASEQDEQQRASELPEVLYAQAMLERAEAQQKQMLMNEALQREEAHAKLADRRKAAIAAAFQRQMQPELQKRLVDDGYFVQTLQDQPSSEAEYEGQMDLASGVRQQDARDMELEQTADENLAKFGMELAHAAASRHVMESNEQLNGDSNEQFKSAADAKTKPHQEKKKPSVVAAQKELPVAIVEPKDPPKVPAKKGQYEFVEFVEPRPSGKLRGIEIMEKRVPIARYNDHGRSSFFNMFLNTGNLLFLAAIAMCCMMAATVTAGAVYYYKRVRTSRDDPFDEFMRYSPTGPGRDKLKKAHLPPSRQSPTGGDDTLAYRAQLQHYRQTKQRIIGGPCGLPPDHIVVPSVSDDEDDDELDKHNFSVYECPGLAPTTGDIEVQNPNFVGSGGGSSGRRGSGSVKSPSPAPSQSSDRLDE